MVLHKLSTGSKRRRGDGATRLRQGTSPLRGSAPKGYGGQAGHISADLSSVASAKEDSPVRRFAGSLAVFLLLLTTATPLLARKIYIRYSYKDDFMAVETVRMAGTEYLPLREIASFVGARCYFYEMPRRLVVSKGANRSTFILGGDLLYAKGRLRKHTSGCLVVKEGEVLVSVPFGVDVLGEVLGIPVRWEDEGDQITIGKGATAAAPAPSGEKASRPKKQPKPRPYTVRKVVIDAGHGGYDSGAVGPTKYYEKTATLDIAQRCRKILAKRKDIKVVMTRDKDRFVSLEKRVARANKSKADLFVSIHCNASRSRYARGAETYIYSAHASNSNAARSADRENLATNWMNFMMVDMQHEAYKLRSNNLGIQVIRQVKKSLGLKDRKVEKGPFYVLASVKMPAVLVEVAFISNPKEEAKLKTLSFRQKVAEAICRAIIDYKELVEGNGKHAKK